MDYTLIETDKDLLLLTSNIKPGLLFLDLETTGSSPRENDILLLSIKLNSNSRFLINCKKVTKLSYLLDIINNTKDLTIVGHNIKFDAKFIFQKFNILLLKLYDTMIAEAVLTAGLDSSYSSLQALVNKYANVILNKEARELFIGKRDNIFTEEELTYSITDVEYLENIYFKQTEKAKELNLTEVINLEMALLPVVVSMETFGVKIDVEALDNLIEFYKDKAKILKEELKDVILSEIQSKFYGKNLYEIACLLNIPVKTKNVIKSLSSITDIEYSINWIRDNINLNSSKQMLTILNLCDIPVQNTNEQTLRDYESVTIVNKLLEYRDAEKLVSTYGENLLEKIDPKTKTIYPEFNQVGTATGRFSSSNPNCQNIPAISDYRKIFVPRAGYKFITVDYNQQEYRLAGALANDKCIIDAYKNNYDIHTLTASIAFKCNIKDVTKEQRRIGKTINFLTLYGGSAKKLHKVLQVPIAEAEKIIENLHHTYSTSVNFREKFGQFAYERGYSVTAYKRKRFYSKPLLYANVNKYNEIKNKIMRQAYNALVQGTGADIIKLAMVACFYENPFGLENFRIILQVHDEAVFEVKEEYVEEAKNFIKEKMEGAEQPFLGEIPASVEISINDYWAK